MKTHLKIRGILPVLVLMAVTSAFAADQTENHGQLSSSDYKFAKEAACGGMFEVNLGSMAAANSQNTAVQQFGRRMATDHTRVGQQLQQIASSKGATLPTELDGKKQKEVDRLSKLTGPEFDKAYLACMVKAHKTDEKAFKKASEEVQDPDLKNFAGETLPMIQDHLKMAQDLDESVKHQLSMNP